MSTGDEDAKPARDGAFDWRAFTPEDSPKTPVDIMSDPRHIRLSTPDLAVGDPAFDFDRPLFDFTESEVRTAHRFHLVEAARKKPVALIFGSYT